MVDSRFYIAESLTLTELARASHSDELVWDKRYGDIVVNGAGTVPCLGSTDLGFITHSGHFSDLSELSSGVVVVPDDLDCIVSSNAVIIRSREPYRSFVSMLNRLFGDATRLQYETQIDKMPRRLGRNCKISDSTVLGADVEIGDDVIIGAHTTIGHGVRIGHGTVVGDNVSVHSSYIGDNCRIHSGARIGNEGFGFIPTDGGAPIKIPQLGRAILQNNVEVRSNATIDRGTLDDTIIGENTKIDNQVQIAHNVRIGRNCQISAQSGIAGSSRIGDNVLLGGRVGVVNKAILGDKSRVMACALVTKNVRDGSTVAGVPAMDVRLWRKKIALERMPMRKQIERGSDVTT